MATLTCLATPALASSGRAASRSSPAVKYRGLRIAVPAGWPVVRLRSHPRACVRFDRHAIYLGSPSAQQRCPAHTVGRTAAILVQPLAAGAARAGGPVGSALDGVSGSGSGSGPGGSSVSAGQLALPRQGLLVTATWIGDRRVVEHALGGRRLHAVAGGRSSRSRWAASAAAASTGRSTPAVSGVFTGLGFDACSAPSATAMSAWGASPYRGVGIYIGGVNAGCAQPNLTPAWVSQETAVGWHMIPTYVGLQAPGACGCASLSLKATQAAAQGSAAASDAVVHAQALGIGPGNPIYDDMEAYSRTAANTAAVLAFVSGWTQRLHALGYVSGIYSSGDSGIADLAAAYGSGSPDDIWSARWNGQPSTADSAVPSSEWANHQRLHQYSGGHNATYGGVTLNIDSDYLDGATAGAAGAVACTSDLPDGTFVQVAGSDAIYRIAGGAPLLVTNWSAVGGLQPVEVITPDEFDALCSVPRDGTFLATNTGAYYRVAGGAPLLISNWSLFGGLQPYVAIDKWDVANAGTPAAHLDARPVSGTRVHALASNTYWKFKNSYRTPVGPSSRAVGVDDAGLAPFRVVQCTVPKLRHATLATARKAISKAQCVLGKVRLPARSAPHHKLRVYWQLPRSGTAHTVRWRVALRLR